MTRILRILCDFFSDLNVLSFFLFSYWYEHDHKFSRQQSQQRQPNSEVAKATAQDLRVSDVKWNAEFTPANTKAARTEARATRANTTSVADLQAQVEAANAKATQAEARAKRAEDEVVRLKAQLKAPEMVQATMSHMLFSVLYGFTTRFCIDFVLVFLSTPSILSIVSEYSRGS